MTAPGAGVRPTSAPGSAVASGRRAPAARTVLSLGSNLGDRLAHLRTAVAELAPSAVSSVWETEPVGRVEQGPYLNAVVVVEGATAAAWEQAQRAERQAGRRRDVRWGPRTLDVDVVTGPGPHPSGLLVPHPRAHERVFVLAPRLEVEPDAELPGRGSAAALLARLDRSGARRTGWRLR